MLYSVFRRPLPGPMLQIRGVPLGDEMHDIVRSIGEVLGPRAGDLKEGMVLNTFGGYLLSMFLLTTWERRVGDFKADELCCAF